MGWERFRLSIPTRTDVYESRRPVTPSSRSRRGRGGMGCRSGCPGFHGTLVLRRVAQGEMSPRSSREGLPGFSGVDLSQVSRLFTTYGQHKSRGTIRDHPYDVTCFVCAGDMKVSKLRSPLGSAPTCRWSGEVPLLLCLHPSLSD